MKVAIDAPLAEITLRRYEKPDLSTDKRGLIKKFCLSIGLLQPGDGRDVVVDVLFVLADAGKAMTSEGVREAVIKLRKSHNLPLIGIAHSNILRQLKRLRSLFIVEAKSNKYRIGEHGSFKDIFQKIERFFLPSITGRIADYCEVMDKVFNKEDFSKKDIRNKTL